MRAAWDIRRGISSVAVMVLLGMLLVALPCRTLLVCAARGGLGSHVDNVGTEIRQCRSHQRQPHRPSGVTRLMGGLRHAPLRQVSTSSLLAPVSRSECSTITRCSNDLSSNDVAHLKDVGTGSRGGYSLSQTPQQLSVITQTIARLIEQSVFLRSFCLIFGSELGDKTFWMSAMLAAQYGRVMTFCGVLSVTIRYFRPAAQNYI
jgi:hypothetical protein